MPNEKDIRNCKLREYSLFELEASLAIVALARAKVPIASLSVSGGEYRINMEAPIHLSLGKSMLSG